MTRFHVDPNERIEIKEFEPGSILDETGQPAIPNVIFIRARMNVAIQDKVRGATVQIGKDGKEAEMDMGPYLTALLVHNILAWAGPDFDGLPCTPENIENLPGNDPFIERVRNEIAERNKSITPKKKRSYRERWIYQYEHPAKSGKPQSPIGNWSLYIALAERYQWTPRQVGELDPEFLDELLAKWDAEALIAARKKP